MENSAIHGQLLPLNTNHGTLAWTIRGSSWRFERPPTWLAPLLPPNGDVVTWWTYTHKNLSIRGQETALKHAAQTNKTHFGKKKKTFRIALAVGLKMKREPFQGYEERFLPPPGTG